jgi:F-type H+-transporting ATPase subunit b
MDVIFHQLGHLLLQSVPTIILVFLLFIVLDRILFRPVLSVLKQREELTSGALARARDQGAAADVKSRQYEEAFQSARQEVYRQREVDRRANVERRDADLRLARQQAEAVIAAARSALELEVVRAKAELDG